MKDKLSQVIRNARAFDDKAPQVAPSTIKAFGISLCSRYAKCGEIISMLQFAEAAALASVAHYVERIFYDSKASICSFELDPSVIEGLEIERTLIAIAKRTIPHFFWFDHEYLDGGAV